MSSNHLLPLGQSSVTAAPDQRRAPPWRRAMPFAYGLLLCTTLWLLSRPYGGIRHDAILYMGQVLARLKPGSLSSDLFFVHGSQDGFTIYSHLMAPLYATLGMASAQMVVLGVSQLSLVLVLALLLRPLGQMQQWMGVACVAGLSHLYGGQGNFGFAENFVTARTVAEPLALAALACVVGGRRGAGVLLLGLSATAHPLAALPVMVLAWLWLVGEDRRWLVVCVLPGFALALAAFDIDPFARLIHRYDPAWWEVVAEINKPALLSEWTLPDWQIVAMDVALLMLGMRRLPQPFARLSKLLLVAGALLLAISAVGGEAMHNVLLMQLQTWRVMWIVHVIALAMIPTLGWTLWQNSPRGWLVALALACAVVATNARWEMGWAFLLWLALTLRLTSPAVLLPLRSERLAMCATATALIGLTLASGWQTSKTMSELGGPLTLHTWIVVLLSLPLVSLGSAALALNAWRLSRSASMLASAMLASFAVYAGSTWDGRTGWVRTMEAAADAPAKVFNDHIPPGAQVYWRGETAPVWALLGRPSHFSRAQGAGVLFNRGTALEFQRRSQVFAPFDVQLKICSMLGAAFGDKLGRVDCPPDEALVANACRSEASPDFMVLDSRLPRRPIASWAFTGTPVDKTYYLYDCKQFR